MGLNTLNDRSDGQTITEDFYNDIHTAMNGSLVGRNSSGVPEANQSLGTAALPWGTLFANGLVVGGSAIDVSQVSAPTHRIVSGATRSTSGMPAFVVPAGTAGGASATVVGLSENLVYDVGGITETLEADIVKGSLTLAPSTNNTCLVNDTDATGQDDTRLWGEQNPFATKKEITIDTIGSEISTLDGKLAAFKIGSELFLAEVDTTNNVLKNAQRGWFLDSANTPIKREVFNNNDTITLMKAAWLFLDSDGTTVDVTYNEPAVSATAPTSPQTGDYWHDIGSNLMKRYSGASFDTVTRAYVGLVVLDDTDCIGARAVDFDKRFKDLNTLELEIKSSEIIRASNPGAKVSVYGSEISFGTDKAEWNITTQLASASDMYQATEQADTFYGVYLDSDGEAFLSDIEPHNRPDLAGLYHPYNDWRMVGRVYNDSSLDIDAVGSESTVGAAVGYAVDIGIGTVRGRKFFTVTMSGTDLLPVLGVSDNSMVKVLRDSYYNVECVHYFNQEVLGSVLLSDSIVTPNVTGVRWVPGDSLNDFAIGRNGSAFQEGSYSRMAFVTAGTYFQWAASADSLPIGNANEFGFDVTRVANGDK